ncbi:MAG: DUF1223 domain-containing protein [Pseudomonadota bacterium]
MVFSGLYRALPALALLLIPTPVAADGPRVVELFSSVVCKYCPAAEAAFETYLKKRPDVIALNCFVKVVNLGGDTISRPACSVRQRQFANTLRNGSIATPMYALNGREMIPHVRTEYEAFMQASLRDNGDVTPLRIFPAMSPDAPTQVSLPSLPRLAENGKYGVWLVTTRKPFTARILRQKERRFTHVVRDMQKLTDWDGYRRTLSLRVTPAADTDKMIILVDDPAGRIAAAGQVTWR